MRSLCLSCAISQRAIVPGTFEVRNNNYPSVAGDMFARFAIDSLEQQIGARPNALISFRCSKSYPISMVSMSTAIYSTHRLSNFDDAHLTRVQVTTQQMIKIIYLQK